MEIWSLARFPEGEEPAPRRAARGVGARRFTLATDPRAGLLEPAETAEGSAREGLRVHASERAARGPHLELRTDHRRLPRRPSRTSSCSRRCSRSTWRPSTSRSSTSASERPTMSTKTTYADVAEGVRATIAAYTQALDDGRTDDVVATFCADGVVRHPGHGHPRRPRRAPRGVHQVEAAAAPASPRGQHARHRLERPRSQRDQRRDLHPARRIRLGDPARGPIPRHAPPRRRHVALPPSGGRSSWPERSSPPRGLLPLAAG